MGKNKQSQNCRTMLEMVNDRVVAEILKLTSKINKPIKPLTDILSPNSNIPIILFYKDNALIEVTSGDYCKDDIKYFHVEQLIEILEMLENKEYKILTDEQLEEEYGIENMEDLNNVSEYMGY